MAKLLRAFSRDRFVMAICGLFMYRKKNYLPFNDQAKINRKLEPRPRKSAPGTLNKSQILITKFRNLFFLFKQFFLSALARLVPTEN